MKAWLLKLFCRHRSIQVFDIGYGRDHVCRNCQKLVRKEREPIRVVNDFGQRE